MISRRIALGTCLALISLPLTGLAPAVAGPTTSAAVPSTATLTLSPSRLAVRRGTTTATVVVTAADGTPTGEVRFFLDNVEIGRRQLTDGSAQLRLGPFTRTGRYVLTAGYAGDRTHGAVSSAPVTLTVVRRG